MKNTSSRPHIRSYRLAVLLYPVALFLLLSSCTSAQKDPIVEVLLEQPLVSVPAENPFVASRQLLSNASAQSSTINAFITTKGLPTALRANDRKKFILYYPESGEKYFLQREANLWALSGPAKLSSLDFQLLRRESNSRKADPSSTTSNPKPTDSIPENRSQYSMVHPKLQRWVADETLSEAEQNSRGDVVHTTRYPGETLALISEWYTFDLANAALLARINGISQATILLAGTRVTVPKYLVQNRKSMNEEVVRSYQTPVKAIKGSSAENSGAGFAGNPPVENISE